MKKLNVAVLGATGAVGMQMVKVLEERGFPLGELRLLSSARSAGKKVLFAGKELTLTEAAQDSFKGIDIVLGAAENDVLMNFLPAIKQSGAVLIDNSSTFRLDPDVPLVVPEINGADALKHKGIISNPNCSTIIAFVALSGILKLTPVESIIASTYQAVSGAGQEGMTELEQQVKDIYEGRPVSRKVFAYQIAYNLIPQIGGFDDKGYTSEEMKMQNEGRKIAHLPDLNVTCTCVRVPVKRSHSISLSVLTKEPISVEQARKAVADAPGCKLLDDWEQKSYPMPLFASDQDIVHVGRIRKDLVFGERGLALWCSGDQVRKGAATNCVQIAEIIAQG